MKDELQRIKSLIYEVRGRQVMLDEDLAEIYQVETRVLNQAVKRNIDRFPVEFMFQLTKEEYENLKSQFVISSWGGRRKLPFAFTEHWNERQAREWHYYSPEQSYRAAKADKADWI